MPRLQLEPVVAARLIDRLSTDDAFRNRFATDTATALHEVGHIADVAELNAFLGSCFCGVTVADKATIAGTRDEIYKMLTQGTSYSVPMRDANVVTVRGLRETIAA